MNEDPAIFTTLRIKALCQYKLDDLSRYNVNATYQRLIKDWDLLKFNNEILHRQCVVEEENFPL